jgi:hypothetical protein
MALGWLWVASVKRGRVALGDSAAELCKRCRDNGKLCVVGIGDLAFYSREYALLHRKM